jgi:hypothetical protein
MTALAWIETKAIPAVKKWWKPAAVVVGFILVVIVGKILIGGVLAMFGAKPSAPPADAIVAKADAEKAKIAETIKADSDQGVADAFNAAVKKVQP